MFVYQGAPAQQAMLRSAVDKIKFPWPVLLAHMGGDHNIESAFVNRNGLNGVPGTADQYPTPFNLTSFSIGYYDMATIHPGALSTSNPYGGVIAISQNYQNSQSTTDFLVAYELGHIVDWHWLTDAMRAQITAIQHGQSSPWLGGNYADNNGEAWCSGFGMAFADGYPRVPDSSHHRPYPPAAVPQLYAILGVQRVGTVSVPVPTGLDIR
jgi:hypothetical protein